SPRHCLDLLGLVDPGVIVSNIRLQALIDNPRLLSPLESQITVSITEKTHSILQTIRKMHGEKIGVFQIPPHSRSWPRS
ncbi:hypothetical protein N8843_10795, partial [Verrucomicrobia bacterium]|nr:hypothetical protein [Verrucomicrobiota bacterium]